MKCESSKQNNLYDIIEKERENSTHHRVVREELYHFHWCSAKDLLTSPQLTKDKLLNCKLLINGNFFFFFF